MLRQVRDPAPGAPVGVGDSYAHRPILPRGGPRAGASFPDMVHAFVLIDAAPSRVAPLAAELAEVDGVAEVYSVAGHADLVAVVRVRHHEELAEVVTRRIHALEGITDTRTLIAFQAYSRRDLEALWDLGAQSPETGAR